MLHRIEHPTIVFYQTLIARRGWRGVAALPEHPHKVRLLLGRQCLVSGGFFQGRNKANVLQKAARVVIYRPQILGHHLLRFSCLSHQLIHTQKQGEAFLAQFGPRFHQFAPHMRRPCVLSLLQPYSPQVESRPRVHRVYRNLSGVGFFGGFDLALAFKYPPEQIQQLRVIRGGFNSLFQGVFCPLFASEQAGKCAVDLRGFIVGAKGECLIISRHGLVPTLASHVGDPHTIVHFGQYPTCV